MKPVLEHLRQLNAKHKKRVNTAEQIASKIKLQTEAAQAAAVKEKGTKE